MSAILGPTTGAGLAVEGRGGKKGFEVLKRYLKNLFSVDLCKVRDLASKFSWLFKAALGQRFWIKNCVHSHLLIKHPAEAKMIQFGWYEHRIVQYVFFFPWTILAAPAKHIYQLHRLISITVEETFWEPNIWLHRL